MEDVLLVLVEVGTNRVLQVRSPIDDYPAGSWQVAPGESVRQTVRLAERYPSLLGVLSKRSVVVFWSLVLPADGSSAARREGGVLAINCRDRSIPECASTLL
jgi:hypothetical protein